ncbi:MAG: ROK family protein [Omnitrophica WOR_2 bacterium]
MSQYIAVDIGGTQMRAAVYNDDNLTPIVVDRISTRHPTLTPIERLYSLIASIWPSNLEVTAIGVAAAGPLDPYAGIIREAPNITGWIDIPLRRNLEERFNVPVAVGNDANMAALGEWKYGAGQGHHNLIYITVSTGIGGGVIVADQLLLGAHGLAAELGHVTIVPDGPMCGCGHRGHLEAFSSGPAIARWAAEELKKGSPSILSTVPDLTAKAIGQAALRGDALAKSAISRAGKYLGMALANYLHIFNPSIVIIGGGVSQTGTLLMEPMRTSMQVNTFSPYYLEDLTLTTASLGDDVGLVGALALAHSIVEGTLTLTPSCSNET